MKNKKGLSQPSQRRWVEFYGGLYTRAKAMRKELKKRRNSEMGVSPIRSPTRPKDAVAATEVPESPPTEALLRKGLNESGSESVGKEAEHRETLRLHTEHVVMRVNDDDDDMDEGGRHASGSGVDKENGIEMTEMKMEEGRSVPVAAEEGRGKFVLLLLRWLIPWWVHLAPFSQA